MAFRWAADAPERIAGNQYPFPIPDGKHPIGGVCCFRFA